MMLPLMRLLMLVVKTEVPLNAIFRHFARVNWKYLAHVSSNQKTLSSSHESMI